MHNYFFRFFKLNSWLIFFPYPVCFLSFLVSHFMGLGPSAKIYSQIPIFFISIIFTIFKCCYHHQKILRSRNIQLANTKAVPLNFFLIQTKTFLFHSIPCNAIIACLTFNFIGQIYQVLQSHLLLLGDFLLAVFQLKTKIVEF